VLSSRVIYLSEIPVKRSEAYPSWQSTQKSTREPPENVTVKGFIKEDMERIITTGLLLTLMSTISRPGKALTTAR